MAFEAVNIRDLSGVQVIEIPASLKINDDKVYLKKVGNALYVIPFHDPWKGMMESVNEFSADFMEDRQQIKQQVRETFD